MVVGVASEWAAESNGKGWDVDVEVALVRAVCGSARPKGWGTEGEITAVECCGGACVNVADFVFAVLAMFCYFVGATFTNGEFAYTVGGGGAVDGDGGKNEVARLVDFE